MTLFVATTFGSAGLLFLSEPMVGKLLLPVFGGAPGVWNTCMVFFQALLLAGYLYTHWSLRVLGIRRQMLVHGALLVLSLAALPLALPAWAGNNSAGQPLLRLLVLLAVVVGAPFFVLSTSGPLLQRWFANTRHPHAKRPYFLYAAGNLGSFLALLSYPFVVEPLTSLRQQGRIWSTLYVGLVTLVAMCMIVAYRQPVTPQETTQAPSPSWRQRGLWVFYAFIPSSLLLGITAKVTVDIAAVPLLWIIPLALYLLTFVVAFGVARAGSLAKKIAPLAAAGLGGSLVLLVMPFRLTGVAAASVYFVLFALIALVAHSRLATERPDPACLTEFYVWVAIGGVLGGVFNSLVAPVIFNDLFELPLVLALAIFAVVDIRKVRGITKRDSLLAFTTCVIFLVILATVVTPSRSLPLILAVGAGYLLFRYSPVAFGLGLMSLFLVPVLQTTHRSALLTKRTFYGVVKIREADGMRTLLHGTTVHGSQYIAPEKAQEPTTYYDRRGPLGDIMSRCRAITGCQQIAGVGEGTGTIAAYGEPGGTLTFYEIDPLIDVIASQSQYFSYISKSKAKVRTVIGDGRLSLDRTTDAYDILVLDAFSSDSIPTHLLTREALQLYQRRLTEHGLLAVHISNRNLNLEPVLAAATHDQDLHALTRFEQHTPASSNPYRSHWVVLAKHAADIEPLHQQPGWRTLNGQGTRVWTDDYSNILDILQ
jgi:hypothetical protein